MKTGLVSVSFRQLAPAAIIDLCLQTGLSSIEWGGDIHVPHGEESTASEVGAMTRSAGLSVAAYYVALTLRPPRPRADGETVF